MTTGKQIRAARMLAGWSAEELAEKAEINRETVLNIERKVFSPRPDTLAKIIRVFDENGVEFIGERGTALKDDQIVTLNGDNVFFRVLDDVISTLRDSKFKSGKEALFACVRDKLSPPVVVENYRRLRKEKIRMRSLVKEGDTYLMGDIMEYRYLPAAYFTNTPQIIYGDKVATLLYSEGKKRKSALIMRNAQAAAAQRNLFNFIWSVAQKPEKTDATVRYDQSVL
jgi:transcriptional regulator with XRE-family HTH domain